MRLRWYDRILVSLSGLVLTTLGALVILGGCGVLHLPEPFALDVWTGGDWQWLPAIFLGGLLIALWGLRLLIRPMCPKKDMHGRYFTVKTGGDDTLSISVSALDQLVRKCLDARPEVLTSRISIGGQERAMRVTIRVTLRGGVCIPETVGKLQEQIKQYVSSCSGVAVEFVRVVVEATKAPAGSEEEVKLLEPASVAPAEEAPAKEPEPMKEPEPKKRHVLKPRPEKAPVEAAPAWYEAAPVEAPAAQTPLEPAPETPAEPEPEPEPEPAAQAPAEPEPVPAPAEPPMFDFGPAEPLPVELSPDAFPFPGEKADAAEETPDA